MTTPDGTKQARFTLESHRKLMDLAAQLGGTADDALRHLLGLSTIRVPVTDIQRDRWIEAAEATGVSVDEFVRLRIEACLQFGTDGIAIRRVVDGVDALCRQAGLRPVRVDPKSTDGPRMSTPNRPEA